MNGNVTFWKKVGIVAGAIGAILGVMISWQAIEILPRWAWYSEVAQVQDFAKDTRILVLGQEWERLDQQITRLEEKGPTLSPEERELLSTKRLRKATVEQQLNALQSGK